VSEYDFKQAYVDSRIKDNLQGILASVFESTNKGILIVDANNAIAAVNPAFVNITGYKADAVMGKNPNILNSGRQNKTFYSSLWNKLHTHGFWEGEIWNRRKNGEIYPEWLSITLIKDAMNKPQYYVGTFSDISAMKTSEDKLIQLAFYDPLTRLPNRVLFQDRLNQTLAQAKRKHGRFALCFIDLDSFKQINDTYGHLVGDAVLMKTAKRLKKCIRESDTVARLSGDEFTIIADNISCIADITAVANKIIESVIAKYQINGHDISCGISMGVAMYPESGTDAKTLIRSADTAMYAVKKSGKNGFHFHALPNPLLQQKKSYLNTTHSPAKNAAQATVDIRKRARK
jgi:two-component system CheB/CheR fusion protein